MDSTKMPYASFPIEWTVKSTSYQIRYRKAFNTNEIDEIYCSIINAKGNKVNFSELGSLLGFNLEDLAETDILNIYLKGLIEYNLIEIDKEVILLTDFGQYALQSKLKYKYYFAETELLENQTATGESLDFSFKSLFDIENSLSHEREITKEIFDNPQLKQKLQLQLFGTNIYKGEIIELYQTDQCISYESISLECEPFEIDNSFQLSIYKGGLNKPDIQFLIDLPENEELKSKLIRRGMYHHILSDNDSISLKDIQTYIDLWNWKELAENPKTDWNDKNVFKLFLENGDGSVWNAITEKAPIESIKSVIKEYDEYWNWNTLTERFENDFIKEQIENFGWDFEELSYKETELVTSLLSNSNLKEKDWDWNYLSKNLPDDFIEKHIDDFTWDFYLITEIKSGILRNLLSKGSKNNFEYAKILLSKSWNWKFISNKFDVNFLYSQISSLSERVDWHTVLNRFFNNEEITAKCLQEESFKSFLKQYLPEDFVIAHQKYLWTINLIDFFEQQNLIQWESKSYIKGFDTNENVEWSKTIFEKYHSRITTEKGFLNVSQQISDYSLIARFPDFKWDWEGISQNKSLISNNAFIEQAFVGGFSFSNNLLWTEILLHQTFDIAFWNKNLLAFHSITDREKQSLFWKLLTQKENQDYIFANPQFPWDWSFITENSTEETILDSFADDQLLGKWDWEIATRKIDKAIILENLEDFAEYINWGFLINKFTIENELSMDKLLPRIAKCLSILNNDKRKDFWKAITAKYPFSILFPIVEATYKSDIFEWDWDYISNQSHFPTDIETLKKYSQNINWNSFSDSQSIKRKFEFKKAEWNDNFNEYFKYTLKYLTTFENHWAWKVLSKNSNLHYNREIVIKFQNKWDWQYLSEYGGFLIRKKKDKDDYLLELLYYFPLVDFEFLSKRKDINIEGGLILSTKDKKWDWLVLSENEKVEVSNELILELKDKNWNWKEISKRKNLTFDNETLLQLLDKDLDWNYLSKNENLEFNTGFIDKTKAKFWNWKIVSRHNSFLPTIEVLSLTKDFDLDWAYLSKHSGLNPNIELLAKFENKWNWQSITQNSQINFTDIAFIERFAYKWDWGYICEHGKLNLTKQILTKFKEHLEWKLISSNTNLNFTKEIIQEFGQFWNWTELKENKRVEELLGNYVSDEIGKSAALSFIDKIEQQYSKWKGSIYHFSHIDNSVQIIREMKIKSRNTANQLSDSAGNVVYSRTDAHSYARFYFRPHTQTQFYNEYLGVDIGMGYNRDGEWHSWYEKEYRLLDFPKCPKPIYFEFSLQEVLFTIFKKCNISTGNMQRNKTKFGKIEQMMHLFNFEDLFINPGMDSEEWKKFREYAQQEFMIESELDFSNLKYFKIICANEDDRSILIRLLGSDSIEVIKNIVIDNSYYRNENPAIRTNFNNDSFIISTNKNAEGYFILTGSNVPLLNIIKGDVIKQEESKISFKSFIEISNPSNIDITVKYIDEINQEWFICSNYQLNKRDYQDIRIKTIERKALRVGQFHNNIF